MIRILGVMTGTSCDGLDLACVRFSSGDSATTEWHLSLPYPSSLRKRILEIQRPGTQVSLKELLHLDRDLGHFFGNSIRETLRRMPQPIDAIANHGQTVAHFPDLRSGGNGVTLQLGEPSRISTATQLTVISHFRAGDQAAGGQGAPLVPLFHLELMKKLGLDSRAGAAIHNLGGISNLTYSSKRPTGKRPTGRAPVETVLAFDTGPGNIWIDAAASWASGGRARMDHDGKMAARGKVQESLVAWALRNSFFRRSPPKSTGRDDFPFAEFLRRAGRISGPDLVATCTAISSRSIVRAYEEFILKKKLPLSRVLFCGGGARNSTLLRWVREGLTGWNIQVDPLSSEGLDPQFVEAEAFAFFGMRALQGKPLGGAWTGATGFGPPAQVLPGKNWEALLKKLSKF